ncbi:MAG: MFS transporter [Microbacteriaceae bacterium]|nr:MFS transporter [Microbacteriaceae bacterium]
MERRRLTGVLVALCVTEIVSYGALYYAFTVLAPRIAHDTGWSTFGITAAFSAGSLLGALAGIPVGRIIQRRGPRPVMVLGSILAAVAVTAVALAPSLAAFFVAWLVVGAATSGLYYPPAFAALTGWFGERRVQAITTLTLAAGFASTIFAPVTNALADRLGWRGAYLVLAGIVLVVNLPAHAFALRLPWTVRETSARVTDREIISSRPFVLLSTSGTLMSFVSYASLVALPVLFMHRGASPALAAWAIGLSGAGQVAGRVIYPGLANRLRPISRAVVVIGLLAVTVLALAVIPGPDWLLVTIAIIAGASRGLFTLVNATLVADLWGPARYASVSGVYNAPLSAAGALAPGIGSGIAALSGGYPALFAILAGVAASASVIAVFAGRGSQRSAAPTSLAGALD